MNVTTCEHLKQYYPDSEVNDNYTIYYSRGSETAHAFICIEKDLEDIKVYSTPDFKQESLEDRLFHLMSKYGSFVSSTEDIIDDSILYEDNRVREEILLDSDFQVFAVTRNILIFFLILAFELVTVGLMWVMGVSMINCILVLSSVLVIDIFMFLAYRKPSLRG